MKDSTALSSSSCRAICQREAPREIRIAISFCRAAARAVNRFATLAHAINRTSPTIPISTNNGFSAELRRLETPLLALSLPSFFLLEENVAKLWFVGRKRLDFSTQDLLVQRLESGLGHLGRDTRLQTAEDLQPAIATVVQRIPGRRYLRLHHHRDKDIARATHFHALVPRLRYADYRHRIAVYQNRLLQDFGIASELPLPEPVREYRDRMCSRCAIILGRDQPARASLQPEHVKVISADEFGRYAVRLPLYPRAIEAV